MLIDEIGNIAAVILAVPTLDNTVMVTDLLASDNDARVGALALLRNIYGAMPIGVMGYLDAPKGSESAYGCARIVNAYKMLKSLAS